MTERQEADEHRSAAERRLDHLLDDVRTSGPLAPGFASIVARRSRQQYALLRVLHVLATIAQTAPRTFAIVIGRDRNNDQRDIL